jgi:hypothetical protein
MLTIYLRFILSIILPHSFKEFLKLFSKTELPKEICNLAYE